MEWPQGIGVVKSVEPSKTVAGADQRKPRPQKEQAINCPRRYWTVYTWVECPVVCIWKNKRSNNNHSSSSNNSSTSSSSSSSKKLLPPANPSDLNLTYNPLSNAATTTAASASNFSNFSQFMASPFDNQIGSSFMPTNNLYSSPSTTNGLPDLHDLKPSSLNFSLDGFENGYGSLQGAADHQEAKIVFPMDDLKINVSTANDQFEENRGQSAESNGFWNGMLGGGGSSW
ncbi:hypothetical protein HAX54_045294 [Datura stramonium]|uniref:Uncharacterized protein n=1 Tax=Datura stramonium TaxID=4076 RepID=A0ABS8RQZ2_DATST|nr:hypothetical protein [Datura stramonium]